MNTDPPNSEYENFKVLLSRVLAVPHSVIVEREAEYRRQAKLNPNQRGPKPKRKPGAAPSAQV